MDAQGFDMPSHTAISPQDAADRLAIRELIDVYAHCADRRDAKGQMSLFTEDSRFRLHGCHNRRTDAGATRTRGPRAGVRQPEHVQGHHSLQRPEHRVPRRGPGQR
ncbi:nuclear transport factor 2 family protein [Streptomyces sp. NBC_01236]|uniref:nuclear transport factor 2 family protein n=1 Tax=Streptomyces sp. NBC_01236 TaxID=2903789 RepID=UPI003FA38E94